MLETVCSDVSCSWLTLDICGYAVCTSCASQRSYTAANLHAQAFHYENSDAKMYFYWNGSRIATARKPHRILCNRYSPHYTEDVVVAVALDDVVDGQGGLSNVGHGLQSGMHLRWY